MFSNLKTKLPALAAAVAAPLAIVPFSAHADYMADATTAIGLAQTNSITIVGLLIGVGVAVWAGMYVKRKFFN